MRPLSSSTTCSSCGPSREGDAGPAATCTDSSARRSRSAAAAGGRPRGRRTVGTSFSMPTTLTSTGGSVVHMRPFPSDSTTQTVPRLRDAEVRAAHADLRGEELLAQIHTCSLGEVGGSSDGFPARWCVRRGRGSPCDSGGSPARGCATTSRRRAAGSARRGRSRSRRSQPRRARVELDLVGRQRLHLDDLAHSVRACDFGDDGVRLRCVARPVHVPAGGARRPPRTGRGTRRGARARSP